MQAAKKSMKKLFSVDTEYLELKQLDIFTPSFEKVSLRNFREYSNQIMLKICEASKLQNCLRILNQENKSSNHSLKYLFFINFAIHDSFQFHNKHSEQLLYDFINTLIQKEKIRFKELQENRANPRSSSIEKATSWLKNRFSKSKQKVTLRSKRTYSHDFTIQPKIKKDSISENMKTSQISQAQSPTHGKQQLFISKMIIPYATYLLKLLSLQINFNQLTKKERKEKCQNFQAQQIWKYINLLKYLVKLGQGFPVICRYYQQHYSYSVYNMIKMIDFEINLIYPIIQRSGNEKFEKIKSQTLQIYTIANTDTKKKVQMLEAIISKYEVNQFKEILIQVNNINEYITGIYMGKYTYSAVKKMNLKPPSFFGETNTSKYDLIFNILKDVEKTRSNSQQKIKNKGSNSSNTDNGEKNKTPNKITKQYNCFPAPIKSKPSTATKLRLKIISKKDQKEKTNNQENSDKSRIEIEKKDQENVKNPMLEQSFAENLSPSFSPNTFRKIRQNITNSKKDISLEDANTRRQ